MPVHRKQSFGENRKSEGQKENKSLGRNQDS